MSSLSGNSNLKHFSCNYVSATKYGIPPLHWCWWLDYVFWREITKNDSRNGSRQHKYSFSIDPNWFQWVWIASKDLDTELTLATQNYMHSELHGYSLCIWHQSLHLERTVVFWRGCMARNSKKPIQLEANYYMPQHWRSLTNTSGILLTMITWIESGSIEKRLTMICTPQYQIPPMSSLNR